MERLLLDVKAVTLLSGSDEELRARVKAGLVVNSDETVQRFVGALQEKRRPDVVRLMAMALGELVLASVLVVAGTVTLAPTVLGVKTPAGLVEYFAEQVYGAIGTSPLAEYVSVIEFVVGAVLVLGAFYTLSQAALNMREAGLSVTPGEG
ncbi:MAG: hypothetical protein HY247_04395 [archaeon]|nr:MAG: hypothetical protein HY247_04395 [archaeon]